jgi:hypothetical protein
MPEQNWTFAKKGDAASLTVESKPSFSRLILWAAKSSNLDFRDKTYEVVADEQSSGQASLEADYQLPPDQNVALFGEMHYLINGKAFFLSTPTRVYPKAAAR